MSSKEISIMKRNLILGILAMPFCLVSCQKENVPTLKDASISEDTKFKSAIVNVSIEDFNKLGFSLGDSCNVKFSNGYELNDIPYFDGYYVKNGMPLIVAYPASTNIAITLNNVGVWDSAKLDETLTVTISLNESKKYLSTQEALGQSYSLERDQYSSDEEFSNFRALSGGSLKDNLIYRGASPVDNSRKRAKITDSLLEKNEIKSIVDLADSKDDIAKYFADENFASTYTKELYEEGKMVTLSMSSSYQSIGYKQSVVKGFEHMLSTEGKYYVHCMEGKDRTGFVCTLIEALTGASYQEMCTDYMKTYQNYYKISEEKTPDKYQAVVSLYFDSFMECLYGTSDVETLKKANYVEGAKKYLKEGGMTEENINKFVKLISK